MPALTPSQLDHFASEGYVVVKGVLDPTTTLDPVIDEYATVLDSLADDLYAQGERLPRATKSSSLATATSRSALKLAASTASTSTSRYPSKTSSPTPPSGPGRPSSAPSPIRTCSTSSSR